MVLWGYVIYTFSELIPVLFITHSKNKHVHKHATITRLDKSYSTECSNKTQLYGYLNNMFRKSISWFNSSIRRWAVNNRVKRTLNQVETPQLRSPFGDMNRLLMWRGRIYTAAWLKSGHLERSAHNVNPQRIGACFCPGLSTHSNDETKSMSSCRLMRRKLCLRGTD